MYLYPEALYAGISPERFWSLSLNEIIDCLEAHYKREKERRKREIWDNFILAETITGNLAAAFSEDGQVIKAWDYYPELFAKEKELDDERRKQEELERYKEAWRKRIAQFESRE